MSAAALLDELMAEPEQPELPKCPLCEHELALHTVAGCGCGCDLKQIDDCGWSNDPSKWVTP